MNHTSLHMFCSVDYISLVPADSVLGLVVGSAIIIMRMNTMLPMGPEFTSMPPISSSIAIKVVDG